VRRAAGTSYAAPGHCIGTRVEAAAATVYPAAGAAGGGGPAASPVWPCCVKHGLARVNALLFCGLVVAVAGGAVGAPATTLPVAVVAAVVATHNNHQCFPRLELARERAAVVAPTGACRLAAWLHILY
jgi:hypothetical protein